MEVQEEGYDAKVKLSLCNLHLQFFQTDSPYSIAVTGLIYTLSWSIYNHKHTALSAVSITTVVSLSLSFPIYKLGK